MAEKSSVPVLIVGFVPYTGAYLVLKMSPLNRLGVFVLKMCVLSDSKVIVFIYIMEKSSRRPRYSFT